MDSFRRSLGILAALLCPLLVLAQRSTGTIRLVVKDASGAPVRAKATLRNLATGAISSFETADQGTPSELKLPFGRYRLAVSKEGFAAQSATIDLLSEKPVNRTLFLTLGTASFAVDVVGTAPLFGLEQTLDEIPAPARLATHREIDASGATELADFLNRRLTSVYLNEVQGNPTQPDLNYRGYTASPLLGTPQGVSVYLDGVRLNQPFGEVVSWDLIPRIAIAEVTLIPGSNPLFGLNTLGGAVSLRTKDGHSQPGSLLERSTLQIGGGSFGRKAADFEHGGAAAGGLHWYLAGSLFFEDGWRDPSPSNVRQLFGKLGRQKDRTALGLTLAYANNALIGGGLQERRFLARDYSSVYTKPDITANRSPFFALSARHSVTNTAMFSGNAYFRYIRTRTLNGDINEDSLDQALYQPGAAERAALAAAGYTGVPASGASAANTPFPFWRCIGNALLRDEPAEKCNGLINRAATYQRNYGVSGQLSWFGAGSGRNQFTVGAAYDGNSVGFSQSTELGYLNPDRSITGVGAFGDGITGGEIDGEPFDTRVDLSGRIHTGSFHAADTLAIGGVWNLTLSGRYNRTSIANRDRIRPTQGAGSLTGNHRVQRFNPAAGVTFQAAKSLNLYLGYSEGNRAPTSIELGCADPETPCKLPNAMAGDPPLHQVVARTMEAGLRGRLEKGLRWSLGWFHAGNSNDILFVASRQTGFGYFKNFGQTLRQGLEVDGHMSFRRVDVGGCYTLLDATFQSREEVNGAGNSTNQAAAAGLRGIEGAIAIEPGNRIPLTPRHLLKGYTDLRITPRLTITSGVVAMSRAFARGNENNLHQPDGTFYLGSGASPGYAIVNIGARYQMYRRVQFFVQANNLLNRRYYTAAQLGPTGFSGTGNFIARPFTAVDGAFPIQHETFYAPGAPRGAWGGIRLHF